MFFFRLSSCSLTQEELLRIAENAGKILIGFAQPCEITGHYDDQTLKCVRTFLGLSEDFNGRIGEKEKYAIDPSSEW